MAPRRKRNLNRNIEKPLYQCADCKKVFTGSSSLHQHGREANHKPFACLQCSYKCKVKKYLSPHVKKVHCKAKGPECTVCGKVFHYGSSLKNHMRVHTGEKPFKCTVCGKAFSSTYCLSIHNLIHTDEKPHKCKFCDYACRDHSTLRRHQERHMGILKKYPCPMCKMTFKTNRSKKIHIDEVHYGLDTKKFACEHCDKRFKIKCNMLKHLKIHDSASHTVCDICSRSVAKVNMATHLQSHADYRPYKCTFVPCSKRFKDRGSLSKHKKIHYPESHYKCDLCDSKFPRKSRLRAHKMTHIADAGCICDYCGVSYVKKSYLICHIRTSHGPQCEKFICDECGLINYSRKCITLHLTYGHGTGNDLKCKMCGKLVKDAISLKEHYFIKHSVKFVVRKKPEDSGIIIKDEPVELNAEFEFNYDVQKIEIDENIPNPEYVDTASTLAYSTSVLEEEMSRTVEESLPENEFDKFFAERLRCQTRRQDRTSDEEYADVDTTLAYSQHVLEEDHATNVIERGEFKEPEDSFEKFFLKQIGNKPVVKIPPKPTVKKDKCKPASVKESVPQILTESQRRKEINSLEHLRRIYNSRIEKVYQSGGKRASTKITYFKKPEPIQDNNSLQYNEAIPELPTVGPNNISNKVSNVENFTSQNILENSNLDNQALHNDKPNNNTLQNHENYTPQNDKTHNDKLDNDTLQNDEIQYDEPENKTLQNNKIQNDEPENNTLQNDKIQNDKPENNTLQNDKIQNDKPENNTLQNDIIQNDEPENNTLQNNEIQNDDPENYKIMEETLQNDIIKNNYSYNSDIEPHKCDNDSSQNNIQNISNEKAMDSLRTGQSDTLLIETVQKETLQNDNHDTLQDDEMDKLKYDEMDSLQDEEMDTLNYDEIDTLQSNEMGTLQHEIHDTIETRQGDKMGTWNDDNARQDDNMDTLQNDSLDKLQNDSMDTRQNDSMDTLLNGGVDLLQNVSMDSLRNDNNISENTNNTSENVDVTENIDIFDIPIAQRITRKRRSRLRKRRHITYREDDEKRDEGYVCPAPDNENTNRNGKLMFNGHECYVCLKLFKTKADLKIHCTEHFDICNEQMLKKCPMCGYVTNKSIKRHVQIVHKMNIKYAYGHVKEKPIIGTNSSKYVFELSNHKELEVIPSISNLNKIAGMKIDEENRQNKNLLIGTTKLVKKSGQWVVEKQPVRVTNEYLLPEFTEEEYTNVKIQGDSYLDKLKKLSYLAKKRGVKMLYPCEGCEKICQTVAALSLHKRKHEKNPKRYKPKVWINRRIEYTTRNRNKNKRTGKGYPKKPVRPVPVEKPVKDTTPSENRFASPQPVKNNHKCDRRLIEFYKSNIKGGDIEFWQFLKIFNKMSRENVNDFEDLENRDDLHFGLHYKIKPQPVITEPEPVTSEVHPVLTGKEPVQAENESVHVDNESVAPKISNNKKNSRKKFTRAIMISKREYMRRMEIKNQMRKKLEENRVGFN